MSTLIYWLGRTAQWLEGGPTSPKGLRRSPDMEAHRGAGVVMAVIDDSPSMEGSDYKPTRLKGAKKALERFLETLAVTDPQRLVGMVVFHGRAKVVAQPQSVVDHKAELMSSVTWESTGSCTNIGEGLLLASREIARIPDARNPRIILLTDGESNRGPNPVKVAEELKGKGIQLDIVGIGGSPRDINEPDLKRMASLVNGELRYWFIKSVDGLVERFEALALREIK